MVALFLLLTALSSAGQADRAEYVRLSGELAKLAQRNAWTGVERTYQQLEALDGVELSYEDYLQGAHAARYQGDVAAARARLKAAQTLSADEREVIDWLWDIDTNYGQVSLYCDPGARELVVGQMPFEPNRARAVQFAQAQIADTGVFEGYLPGGEFTFGDYEFQVMPRVKAVRVDLRTGESPGRRDSGRARREAEREARRQAEQAAAAERASADQAAAAERASADQAAAAERASADQAAAAERASADQAAAAERERAAAERVAVDQAADQAAAAERERASAERASADQAAAAERERARADKEAEREQARVEREQARLERGERDFPVFSLLLGVVGSYEWGGGAVLRLGSDRPLVGLTAGAGIDPLSGVITGSGGVRLYGLPWLYLDALYGPLVWSNLYLAYYGPSLGFGVESRGLGLSLGPLSLDGGVGLGYAAASSANRIAGRFALSLSVDL